MIRNLSMFVIGTLLIFGVPIWVDFNLPKDLGWVAALFFVYGMVTTKFLEVLWPAPPPPPKKELCKSCRLGYNGRYGMGYQPCPCQNEKPAMRPAPPPPPPPPGQLLMDGSMKSNTKLPKYEEDVREEFDDGEYAIRLYQEENWS